MDVFLDVMELGDKVLIRLFVIFELQRSEKKLRIEHVDNLLQFLDSRLYLVFSHISMFDVKLFGVVTDFELHSDEEVHQLVEIIKQLLPRLFVLDDSGVVKFDFLDE